MRNCAMFQQRGSTKKQEGGGDQKEQPRREGELRSGLSHLTHLRIQRHYTAKLPNADEVSQVR